MRQVEEGGISITYGSVHDMAVRFGNKDRITRIGCGVVRCIGNWLGITYEPMEAGIEGGTAYEGIVNRRSRQANVSFIDLYQQSMTEWFIVKLRCDVGSSKVLLPSQREKNKCRDQSTPLAKE
jgi:hypothetical protein